MDSVKVFIPSSLDLSAHIGANTPCIPYFNKDILAYVVSLVNSIPTNNIGLDLHSGFVPIHSGILHNTVRHYRKYLDYLIATGVLETNGSFIVGRKSTGYKYSPQHNTPLVPYEITRFTLCQNIRKQRQKTVVSREESDLRKWFNSKLEIDTHSAYAHALKVYFENKKAGDKLAEDKYIMHRLCIRKISEGDFSFIKDNTVGRVHTNFTNMPYWVRYFITYDGGRLVNVDIKNSQPYLATTLFSTEFFELDTDLRKKAKIGKNIYKGILKIKDIVNTEECKESDYVSINSIVSSMNSRLSTLNLRKTTANKEESEELQKFTLLVEQGKLYTYIQNEIFAKTGIFYDDMAEIKLIVLLAFFTSNHFIGQDGAKLKRIFKEVFPFVYKILSIIKKQDYSLLPRLLQAIEAKIMLDRVCVRIGKERPNMPIYTIHDSIACPQGNEDYVSMVIKEEMQTAIGHTPSVGLEYWNPENVTIQKSRERKKQKKSRVKPENKILKKALSLP